MTFIPLSPCCLTGGRLTGTPRGIYRPADDERQVGRYHTTPSNESVVSDKVAMVLYTDFFCLALPNPKIMADAFADALGINVFVPEYIVDPPSVDLFDSVAPLYPGQYASRSMFTSIYMFGQVILKAWRWLPAMFSPKKQLPLAQASLDEIVQEGYTKIVIVGYCRGGAMVQHLLSNSKNECLVGGVICHPTPEESTWSNITKPTLWNLADQDQMFGIKDIDHLKSTFEAKEGVEFQCNVYKETLHGFATRPTLDHEPTKKAFEKANSSAIDFTRKLLFE
ncbi:uncharacterized protein IL334_006551 [Kwoniella shivajii]|uniref:Dienelactone hydrolase domain-containing protein n=1 Tax=Kwoniella shivajii TaxID=564305 RepID=A0ABZ1D693_9TREE|nr:hypothetical protein IL334_006551 [Kwoniella shivajii]